MNNFKLITLISSSVIGSSSSLVKESHQVIPWTDLTPSGQEVYETLE